MYISFARPIVYSSLVYSSPIKPIASAVQSDCVRRPIRFRSPSDQIPFAVRLDSVRRPMHNSSNTSSKSLPPRPDKAPTTI